MFSLLMYLLGVGRVLRLHSPIVDVNMFGNSASQRKGYHEVGNKAMSNYHRHHSASDDDLDNVLHFGIVVCCFIFTLRFQMQHQLLNRPYIAFISNQ